MKEADVSATLDSLLRPSVVAVIGASRDPHKWGQRVLRYSRTAGFSGELLAINPSAAPGSIPGATVLPSIDRAEVKVDCAFLALPKERTLAAVEECCLQGIGTIVVAASGFGESSRAGGDLERQLLELARSSGSRILGPNCFGVYSSASGVNLTPFEYVPRGGVALASQSGNVSAQLFLAATDAGFGFSSCVGVGNQLDIGFGDLLVAFADDPSTRAIALYIEGLPNEGGPRFAAGLRRCREAGKPVIVIKAGASRRSAAVAQTHTRSLGSDDRVWDVVLEHGGAVRVSSVPEMSDVLAGALSLRGAARRIAIVTDGGGDSVLALDALDRAGRLQAARFSEALIDELEHLVPPAAPRVPGMNPLTLDTAGGVEDDPEVLARCVDAIARTDAADVILVSGLFGTYVDAREGEIRAALALRNTAAHRTVNLVFQSPLSPTASQPLSILSDAGLPFFQSVDRALSAIDRLAGASPTEVDELLDEAAESPGRDGPHAPGRQLSPDDGAELLRAHGVPIPTMLVVRDLAALRTAARSMGYPVCVKTASPEVVHKSDVGGVHPGIEDEDALSRAAASLWADLPDGPLLVMPSFPPGFEMLVGGFVDPQFGPVVMVGRGGVLAELEADTQLVAGDITRDRVRTALGRLRCGPVLQGYRSSPPLDVDGLCDVAVALASALKHEPAMAVDLNPVFVYPDRVAVVDVRVLASSDATPAPGLCDRTLASQGADLLDDRVR